MPPVGDRRRVMTDDGGRTKGIELKKRNIDDEEKRKEKRKCYENIDDEVKERKVRERIFDIYPIILQMHLIYREI